MVKAAQKKVISIIVAGVLVILLATGLSIAFDEIYHSRKYPLNLDDWKTEPYAVLRYGKYQGIYRSDDTTFRSYTIKGIEKNDLIYTYQSSGFPWTHSSGYVLMHKNSKINPIKDWSINKIIISKYPIDKKYKDTYAILDQINEQNIIVSLLDIINGEYKEDISEQKIVNIVLLLVFKECPSLALRGDIIKIDEKFYLCIGDKYYDIDIALSQYLIPYV